MAASSTSTAVAYVKDNQPRHLSSFGNDNDNNNNARPMPGHGPATNVTQKDVMRYNFVQVHHRLRRLPHFEVLSFCDPTLLHLLPYESGPFPIPPPATIDTGAGGKERNVNPRRKKQPALRGKRRVQEEPAETNTTDERAHKKPTRGRFVNKTTYSWISTSTKTMVLLPSATVQLVRQPIAPTMGLAIQPPSPHNQYILNNNNNGVSPANGVSGAAYDVPRYNNNNNIVYEGQPGIGAALHRPSRMTVLNEEDEEDNQQQQYTKGQQGKATSLRGDGMNGEAKYTNHSAPNALPELTAGHGSSGRLASSSPNLPTAGLNTANPMPPSTHATAAGGVIGNSPHVHPPLSQSLPQAQYAAPERPASSPGARRQHNNNMNGELHHTTAVKGESQPQQQHQLPPLRSSGPSALTRPGPHEQRTRNNVQKDGALLVQPVQKVNGWVNNTAGPEETTVGLEPGLSIDPAYYAALERSLSDSPLQGYVNGVTTMLETGEL